MLSDGETVSSPIVNEQPPYILRRCFDVKIIILVFSSFSFSMRSATHRLNSQIEYMSRLAVSTWSPGVAGLYDAYIIENRRHIYGILSNVFLISASFG